MELTSENPGVPSMVVSPMWLLLPENWPPLEETAAPKVKGKTLKRNLIIYSSTRIS
jgi:hypothetical protein